jgi:hypothetical protein
MCKLHAQKGGAAMCKPAADAARVRASHSPIAPGIHPDEVVIQPGTRLRRAPKRVTK